MKTRNAMSSSSIGLCTGMLCNIFLGVALAGPPEVKISTATLLAYRALPDGGVLRVQRQFISYPYIFRAQTKVARDTLYFLDFEKRAGDKPVRIWEAPFGADFSHPGLGMPKGFILGFDENRTSSVALAFWEARFLRFIEINPHKPVKDCFEDFIRRTVGSSPQPSKDQRPYYPRKSDRNWLNFEDLIPGYFLDAAFLDSPNITNLWHEKDAWHMTLAARHATMHLVLRDGAKEWVWVNKP